MPLSRQWKIVLSYGSDWVLTIAFGVTFALLTAVPGYRREFSLEDKTIMFSFAVKERITMNMNYFIVGSPIVLQPIINLLTVRSWWDLHVGWLGWLLSVTTTASLTQAIKMAVGRPRPDLLSRCKPPVGAVDPPFGLSNFTICTETDDKLIKDGFESFPSGHTSLAFAGLAFLSFYLTGKLHLFDKRGWTFKTWLALIPLSGAALVGISRTMDYRHHWQDVLSGAILGLALAFFSYRQYYPPLHSEMSHKPFSPRIKRVLEEPQDLLPTRNCANPEAIGMDSLGRRRDGSREMLSPNINSNRYSQDI